MPTLSNHQSNEYTKLLIEGDSGSGKTGALCSLVEAGYKLRILDFDNGLEPLKQFILRDCSENIDNVEFRTLSQELSSMELRCWIDGNTVKLTWEYLRSGEPSVFSSSTPLPFYLMQPSTLENHLHPNPETESMICDLFTKMLKMLSKVYLLYLQAKAFDPTS